MSDHIKAIRIGMMVAVALFLLAGVFFIIDGNWIRSLWYFAYASFGSGLTLGYGANEQTEKGEAAASAKSTGLQTTLYISGITLACIAAFAWYITGFAQYL